MESNLGRDIAVLEAILDSLKDPVVFVDTGHTIRLLNKAAVAHYKEGAALLGRSIMDCHNEQSRRDMLAIAAAMETGEEERLITDKPDLRIYMRAVRDGENRLLGYYERYEHGPRAAAPATVKEG